jgi:hypothetical protein
MNKGFHTHHRFFLVAVLFKKIFMIKKQRNCHARAKRKKAKARAKQKHMRLMSLHLDMKTASTPGEIARRIKNLNKDSLQHVSESSDNNAVYLSDRIKNHRKIGHLNQRQKRKLFRQAPHMRKRA